VHIAPALNLNRGSGNGYLNCAQRSRKRLFVDMRVMQDSHAEFIAVQVQNAPTVGVVIPPGIEVADRHLKGPAVSSRLCSRIFDPRLMRKNGEWPQE